VLGLPYGKVKEIIYPHPRYRAFIIAKRNGTPRVIHEPRRELKTLQLKVLEFLEARSGSPKPCVHGFIRNRSIVTNARKHIERRAYHLLNIDLESFFPSISFYRVRGVLLKKPFEFSHSVATVIAHICTFNNALPQGAPTSPFISNLVCRSLDRDLMALSKRHRATYTRYADDMTFSFSNRSMNSLPANVLKFDGGVLELGGELQATIEKQHTFKINPSKSRLSTRRHRLEVTGLTVNEFPNVKRVFIDRIRGALNAWRKYGYAAAQAEWEARVTTGAAGAYEKRPWKRQIRTRKTPKLQNVLWGKLLYLRMVRGKDDVIYTRLAERYNLLCATEKTASTEFRASSLPIEPIVRNLTDVDSATFVIEWSGDYQPTGVAKSEMIGSQGTAFAYKNKSLLITCDHVLTWTGDINKKATTIDFACPDIHGLTITVHNPILGASWDVNVIHRDVDRDLAVLEFASDPPPHRHFSGRDSQIKRHERGVLIGFPNWTSGRSANQINTTIENRYPRSGLQRFEIAQMIRQGNSGGPFVDELYRVAGVAQQGAQQDRGNNECLCVSELDAWLSTFSIP
jgi:S1-C subfamily serine protease